MRESASNWCALIAFVAATPLFFFGHLDVVVILLLFALWFKD